MTMTRWQVRYFEHRIREIEAICAGRLAGDLRDAALRLMVASSVGGDRLKVVEIGVLFGVNAAILYDVASCLFDAVEMLVVDPLDGYYGAAVRDPATGLRISLKTVRRNFNLMRIPTSDVSIIADRSDGGAAMTAISGETFNYMFIDGDHGYEGVKKDFELYGPHLEQGGFMVFDNYRDDTSPGVDRFVDEMRSNGEYQLVGSVWRSAVFRRL